MIVAKLDIYFTPTIRQSFGCKVRQGSEECTALRDNRVCTCVYSKCNTIFSHEGLRYLECYDQQYGTTHAKMLAQSLSR